MSHSHIMQKIAAVVLAVNMVFSASAEKLFLTEKAESEAQLKTQDLPPDQTLGNENLAAELERILEETVDEALFLQQEGLKAQFEILKNNEQISAEIASKIKPFEFFDDYLSFGYYPYFLEGKDDYFNRLNETLNMILEVELPMLRGLEIAYIPRIKKLLAVIGESAPFIPNITQLAAKIGISRQTLLIYLKYLEDAKLINQLYKKSRGLSVLEKPEKILMENTNLIELFNGENANTGSRRETFVLNQLLHSHKVDFSEESDFFVDSKYTFEVGGKNKKRKQIQEIPDSYIIADDIEFGTDRRIPIWLLGFMY